MIEEKILNTLERFSLLADEKHITVALSGGADSMCLLYALLSLKEKLGVSISALHINHLIRGEEANRDEEFVKKVCNELSVDLLCARIDVPSLAKEEKLSMELAARNARYDFFKNNCKGLIATAHNANDNLETLLLNIARGTSLKGLCGIPIKREAFIRPLLYCTREEIEKYCEEKNIPFVTDSTNLEDDYTRNRIRHNVIPVLKEINNSVELNCVNMCEALKDDYRFIDKKAQEYFNDNFNSNELNVASFGELDISVKRCVIAKFISAVDSDIELSSLHIERLLDAIKSNAKISLPCGFSAICNSEKIELTNSFDNNNIEFSVNIIEKDFEIQKVNNLFSNNLLDCDKICGNLVVRTRAAGDKMRPARRGITKTLKQLFTEYKIPLEERMNLPVLSDDKGVVFVFGIGVAERCAVTDKTKKCFIVEVEKIGDK